MIDLRHPPSDAYARLKQLFQGGDEVCLVRAKHHSQRLRSTLDYLRTSHFAAGATLPYH